jgi:hypothetical protein
VGLASTEFLRAAGIVGLNEGGADGDRNPLPRGDGLDHGAVMTTEVEPVEHEDRWILNLRGLTVARISVDFRLTLALDAGWEVVLEAPTRLSPGSVRTSPGLLLTPESQDVAAVLPLFGAMVLSSVAFKSGALRLVFDGGTHLTCSTDTSFEAWQITGPRGWRFVSLPGGDLAVWSGSGASENPQGRSAKQ